MTRIFCPKCSTRLDPSSPECPKCGSHDRFIDDAPAFPLDKVTLRIIEKSYSEGKKCLYKTTIKPDFDRDTQQDTIVIRKFNKQKECIAIDGSYIEEIRTRDGKLIKKNIGKLVEHTGHGCDRKNRRK